MASMWIFWSLGPVGCCD